MCDRVGDLEGGLVGVADGDSFPGVSVIMGIAVGDWEAGLVGMADGAKFPSTPLKKIKNKIISRINARIANNRRLSIQPLSHKTLCNYHRECIQGNS